MNIEITENKNRNNNRIENLFWSIFRSIVIKNVIFSHMYQLSLKSITFERIIEIFNKYGSENVMEFPHWLSTQQYLIKNYPLEMFKVIFCSQNSSSNSSLKKVIINFENNFVSFSPSSRAKVVSPLHFNVDLEVLRDPIEVFESIYTNSVSIHPHLQEISYKDILLSNKSQLEFICNNLLNYDFGYILIGPKLDSIELANKFTNIFTGVNRLLIYHYQYIKSIFLEQGLKKVIQIEDLINSSSSLSDTNKINPFNYGYSKSFQQISEILNKLINNSSLKNFNKNNDSGNNIRGYEEYQNVPIEEYNKLISKSNILKDYLNNSNFNLLKLIIKRSIKQITKNNNRFDITAYKLVEILNHLGNNINTNTTIFNGLLIYIYHELSLESIINLKINAQYFQQELLEMMVILLLNKEIGKAFHCLKQIKDFGNLYISKLLNFYINLYIIDGAQTLTNYNQDIDLEVDENLDANEILVFIEILLKLVPKDKCYIFKPVFQQLFNYICTCGNSNLNIIGHVINEYKNYQVDFKIGVYHLLYFLNLKCIYLSRFILYKPTFDEEITFDLSNNYNGTYSGTNLFNQKIEKDQADDLTLDNEVYLISTIDGQQIIFELTFESIYKLNFEQLSIILRNLVSEIPKVSNIYQEEFPLINISEDIDQNLNSNNNSNNSNCNNSNNFDDNNNSSISDNNVNSSDSINNFVEGENNNDNNRIYRFLDNLNNDIQFFISIKNYGYSLQLINSNINQLDDDTFKKIIFDLPPELVSRITLNIYNINSIILKCIEYSKLDTIQNLFTSIENNKEDALKYNHIQVFDYKTNRYFNLEYNFGNYIYNFSNEDNNYKHLFGFINYSEIYNRLNLKDTYGARLKIVEVLVSKIQLLI